MAIDAFGGDARVNALAGAIASSAVSFILLPCDMMKTLMQTQGSTFTQGRHVLLSNIGMKSCLKSAAPAITETFISRFALFGIGAVIKQSCLPSSWEEIYKDAIAGSSSALIQKAVLHPMDTIKARWQMSLELKSFGELYQGFVPAAVRSSVGMAIWLVSRNAMDRNISTKKELIWVKHFLIGGISSALVDVTTYPFDTIKRRMQTLRDKKEGGMMKEARFLLASGVQRFYKGYSARILMVVLNGALFNGAFVTCKRAVEGNVMGFCGAGMGKVP